jgi:hypothetical protein
MVEAIQKEIELRFSSLEKAIASTKRDLDIRLEAMNEFRAQLDRQAHTFVPRTEIDLANNALEKKVDLLVERSAEQRGSTKWVDHIITVLIGLAVVLVVWAVKK